MGRLCVAGLSFVAIPVLVGRLGAEAYGLIGFAVALEGLIAFLDLGLSTTVNREVARNVAAGRDPVVNRQLLRTLQVIYWPIGLVIGGGIALGAGWIARSWVHPAQLSVADVRTAVILLGAVLAARWPISLYAGVLRGLQLQVLHTLVLVGAGVLRIAGGVVVVVWISPTLQAFFLWQAMSSLAEACLTTAAAWSFLEHAQKRTRFDLRVLRGIWRFALGFNIVAILGQLLSQSGQVIASKFLPLREVAFLSIAASAAVGVMFAPYALVDAAFPRFAALIQRKDREGIVRTYHMLTRIMVLAGAVIALPVAFFSQELLSLWTRSDAASSRAWATASLLCLGNLTFAIWAIPYVVIVAGGNTRLPIRANAVALAVAIGWMLMSVPEWGIVAVGWAWLGVNMVLLLIYAGWAHRFVLAGEGSAFILKDVAPNLALAGVLFGIARVVSLQIGDVGAVLAALVAGLVCVAVGVAVLPKDLRRRLYTRASRGRAGESSSNG